ncbi:MAG: protein kinase [Lentisphaerales bacterium]|nr:protein kinase [Lentisphaerales bacterium]
MKFSYDHCGDITEITLLDEEYVGFGHCDGIVEIPKHRFDKNMLISEDFVILEEIGIGGMDLVYRAHQISLERIAALKVLKDSFCQNQKLINGFITEASSATQLRHSNIIQAYAVGHKEGIFYIAMEYIEVPTAANMLLHNHTFSKKEIIKIAIDR